ncbi:PREDICTED: PH domain leucine-rich repeat protein phosphatase 1-like [Ceratosolen solmsi marchali]|uniref:PH domain leucine-rich repeat protein phosphatase 1-like n=1 Tax=Ceratosolen solmsi marchali TaxID=326594 RepID=A0AAJ7E3L3_9HYME|nr:PREDICTED: PH domain leucine-rich repeat protein phosphatase 1-like [Ceratosolen solmsi marchali]
MEREVEGRIRAPLRELERPDYSPVSSVARSHQSRVADRSRRSHSSGSKSSSPRRSWTEESRQLEDASAQERSVLRELNEAIDRFEEEGCEADSRINDSKSSGCHDSSWDSGVGGEFTGGAAVKSVELAKGSGWLRVHTGIESSLVYLTMETTAGDVCRDMLLSDNLALFLKYGDEAGRRLGQREKPLELQEQLLLQLGYREATRRARLGLDAELRHLVAFHVGPAAPLDELRGYSRCGYGLILKGLVFPQWKKRPLAVLGSRLFLYPACAEALPEWLELADGGSVGCAPSRLGKLVLRVTGHPRITQRQRAEEQRGRELRHLYLGFQHSWDRDLWRRWLKQACQTAPTTSGQPIKLDMSETGVSRIPETVRSFAGVREFFLGHNQLSPVDGNFKLLLRYILKLESQWWLDSSTFGLDILSLFVPFAAL